MYICEGRMIRISSVVKGATTVVKIMVPELLLKEKVMSGKEGDERPLIGTSQYEDDDPFA